MGRINIFLYLLYQIFSFTIRIIPDRLRYLIGITLGNLVFYGVKKRREIGINNLKMAFPQLSDQAARELTKKSCHHLGLNLVEFTMLSHVKKEDLLNYIQIENKDILDQVLAGGQGIIIYTAHFGNWELLGVDLALQGYSLHVLAQAQNNPYFNERINQIRELAGMRLIPLGMSVRGAFKVLKNREILCIAGDQNAGTKGWSVNFFGRTTATYPGAVQLAVRTGAVIVPAYIIREDWRCHRIKIYQPYAIKKNATEKEQHQLLQELTGLSEEVIREYPEQWLWLHRRWKNSG